MNAERLTEICRALPLFPLPRTVLLPGSVLPLHVFEDRYRSLVAHCMAGERLMGIATLKPGFEEHYEGSPALWPEVGIGELVAHQPLPDGGSNIVLQYVGRARIARELPTVHPFRMVEGKVLSDDTHGIDAAVRSLKVLVIQLGGLSPEAAEEARRLVSLDGIELVDALARRLLDEVDDQRHYLGYERLVDRIALVQDHLARFLIPTAPAGDA